MLLGRERERAEIELALERARSGVSASLGIVGEPGIGKTALLDDAAGRADGMRLLRARGIESEAEIPFASLLELVRPAVGLLGQIPPAQALALETALALRPAPAQERFAVGAGTLSLLAAYAEPAPVAVLIDDAQWLDQSSAQALLFAFRRLVADPIAVVIAVRDDSPSLLDGADLPTLRVSGLSSEETSRLLFGVSVQEATRLYEATAGNPLALLELADDARDVLAPPGAPMLVSTRLSRAFRRRADELELPARRALVLAATSESSDLALLEAAAAALGLDLSSLAGAEGAGLVRLEAGRIEFRHPLARPLSTLTRRSSSGARRTVLLPPCFQIETSPDARGISLPPLPGRTRRPRRHSSGRESTAFSAAPTQPRRQRSSARPGSSPTSTAAAVCCGKQPRRHGTPGWPIGPWQCSTRLVGPTTTPRLASRSINWLDTSPRAAGR